MEEIGDVKTTERILAALAISAIAIASAPADPLPAPSVEFTQCLYDPSGVFVDGALSCGTTGASAQIALSPFAGDTAQASGGFTIQSSALAQFSYYFEVIGGAEGAEVPLIITANLQTSATANSLGEAILDVSSLDGGGIVSQAACTHVAVCHSPADFSGNITTVAVEGQLNALELETEAGVDFSLSAESAFASADPMIEVDPSFPDASEYSIVLSPGVANSVSSVPEPSTGWLFAAGFLAMAFGRVRRRARVTAGLAPPASGA